MIKTCVYFRPGAPGADLIRIGSLYLSRTSDKRSVFVHFMPEPDGLAAAQSASVGQTPMLVMLADFHKYVLATLPAANFMVLSSEPDVVEAAFRLLPTNFKHDAIEGYPPEDFFVRAFRELEEDSRVPKTTVEAETLVSA